MNDDEPLDEEPMSKAEMDFLIHGPPKPPCERCGGSGWLEPIGPCSDGSYITSRPCHCRR